MRIGIFISASKASGGIFQYSSSVLRALHDWDSAHQFVIIKWPQNDLPLADFSGPRWTILTMDPAMAQSQNRDQYLGSDGLDLTRAGINSEAQMLLKNHRIDLLLFPAPASFSFEWGLPYIMAIHDLQHRLQPEFPEVSAGDIWKSREYLFRNGVRYANAILTDSDVGKEDVLNCYGDFIAPDRIYPLPFLPFYRPDDTEISETAKRQVREKYNLPQNFLFYPAQFWLHKNHARLIHAIHILRAVHQIDIPLVLAGSNSVGRKEEARQFVYQNAMTLAEQLGVKDLVQHLGYVPDDDMPFLYAMATALTMPTFFGPTNIPFLEAWAFGCPVITSDIRGIQEQVGDAALRVDPKSADAMADGILKIWSEKQLRNDLIHKGFAKVNSYTSHDFASKLYAVIERVQGQLQIQPPSSHPAEGDNARTIADLNQQGEDLYASGNLEAAFDVFNKALAINPDDAIIHNNLGVWHYSTGDKAKAVQHYEKAAQLQPDNIIFKKNLADFYCIEMGEIEKALQTYNKILEICPHDIETLTILGQICKDLDKFEDAKYFYSRVLEIEPGNKIARQQIEKLGDNDFRPALSAQI